MNKKPKNIPKTPIFFHNRFLKNITDFLIVLISIVRENNPKPKMFFITKKIKSITVFSRDSQNKKGYSFLCIVLFSKYQTLH